jgi:ubiquinone/menaquinone biosynthesis C-methylase UbiE
MTGPSAESQARAQQLPPGQPGILLHSPALYDLMVGIYLLGRERSFRQRLLSLAALRPGERVLDVGCGTGSMAILARRQVGASGGVLGIDASAEMLEWARHKARRAGLDVEFLQAPAQALPLPDGELDVVLSTLMLHHLPRPARVRLVAEARRVLRPRGRLLIVDFVRTPSHSRRWQLPHRHGSVDPEEILVMLTGAGFEVQGKGHVGVRNMAYVLATLPASGPEAAPGTTGVAQG